MNSELFKQDAGGHGGATRGPQQFDGQAIHLDVGWGDAAFGSGIEKDPQVNDCCYICVLLYSLVCLVALHIFASSLSPLDAFHNFQRYSLYIYCD